MRPPRCTLWTLLLLIAAFAVLLAAVIALAPTFQSSNCGGNSAALSDVRLCWCIMEQAVNERPDHQFVMASTTLEQRQQFAQAADDPFLSGRILVSTLPLRAGPRDPRRVVAVCDRPFTNVPRRIFPSPPRHAAAFADGRTSLISPAEFAALDRSTLIPLDDLLAGLEQPSANP